MRIFVAVKPDAVCLKKIQAALTPFQKIPTPIRWIPADQIHLTLKFIGEIDQTVYEKVEQALIFPPAISPFEMEIRGFGQFSRGDDLSIVWAAISSHDSLPGLYRHIEEKLQGIGIPGDKREFKSHLTVGRNKQQFNVSPLIQLLKKSSQETIASFQVDRYLIIQSELKPAGPVYTIKKEVRLG